MSRFAPSVTFAAVLFALPLSAQETPTSRPTPVDPTPGAVVVPASRPAKRATAAEVKPVYDEQADAPAEVAAAVKRAAADNKRVLVVFGANWCGWCVKLSDLCKKDSKIARELNYEYEVVKVDVGRFDKHMTLTAPYADGMKKSGIPYLVVLDGAAKTVVAQETGTLENGDKHDPAKVLAFLTAHKAAPLDAEVVLKDAIDRATKEDKLVFVHFGAPWCGWCKKLEAFVGRTDIAPLMALDYVDVKIDVDRMTHGKDVIARYRKSEKGGIPWFFFMTATGELRGTSDAKGGNIGHPYKPEEVAHFVALLKATAKRLDAAGLAKIEQELLKQEAADKAARR